MIMNAGKSGLGACLGLTSACEKSFAENRAHQMELPTQIQTRLDALGVLASDVEEKFVRGSGPGGQKINKTSSTVWLKHTPTGVEVRIQRERSQAANREVAWAELCEKLTARLRAAEAARRDEIEKNRRRNRRKTAGQKARMVESKRRRRSTKDLRGKVRSE